MHLARHVHFLSREYVSVKQFRIKIVNVVVRIILTVVHVARIYLTGLVVIQGNENVRIDINPLFVNSFCEFFRRRPSSIVTRYEVYEFPSDLFGDFFHFEREYVRIKSSSDATVLFGFVTSSGFAFIFSFEWKEIFELEFVFWMRYKLSIYDFVRSTFEDLGTSYDVQFVRAVISHVWKNYRIGNTRLRLP